MMPQNLMGMMAASGGMAPAAAPAAPAAQPGFLQMLMQLQKQDPMDVLSDPNATGMQKFLTVLMNSKMSANSNGSGFAFAGPGSSRDPEVEKLMKVLGARAAATAKPQGGQGGLAVTNVGGQAPAGGLTSLLRPRNAFA